MSNYLTACRIKARSIKARNRVNIRWARVRAEQAAVERANPISFGDLLACRVIVIPRKGDPIEICTYDFDSDANARRKQRKVVAAMRRAYGT